MLKLILLIGLFHHGLQDDVDSRKLTWKPPEWELDGNSLQTASIDQYLNKWNSSFSEEPDLPEMMFQSSLNDSRMILTDLTNCLPSFNLMDCLKMFLLTRIKILVSEMEKTNTTAVDFALLNGIIIFKWRNVSSEAHHEISSTMDLNRKLNIYVMRLFQSRSLQVKILPGLGLELTPKSVPDDNGLVCFTAKTFKADDSADQAYEMRRKGDKGKKKKKGGGFNMMPMMIVPQMIMLGMLPFAFANLKMMVMNAFMLNSMALNGAIAMTIRNMVFGPKKGPKIKYVNYGYNKSKKNKKPELILHSPAAFVEKPHSPNHDYVRRAEQKKIKNDQRLRSTVQPSPTSVPNYPPLSDSYNHQHNPSLSLLPNEYNEQSYSQSDVDAPISYLNNNQYLQPSAPSYQSETNFEPSNYNDESYQAYQNMKLHPYQSEVQGDGNDFKQTYSSKYKEPADSANHYSNHRLYR